MPKKNGLSASPTNGSASKPPAKPRSKKTPLTTEAIQLRAYEIYLERHGAPGNPLEDWVRAEQELLAKPRRLAKKPAANATAA